MPRDRAERLHEAVVARNDLDELLELDALHRVEERTVAVTLSSDYDIVSMWEKLCLGHAAPPAVAPWRGIVINFEFWFINWSFDPDVVVL